MNRYIKLFCEGFLRGVAIFAVVSFMFYLGQFLIFCFGVEIGVVVWMSILYGVGVSTIKYFEEKETRWTTKH